MSSFSALQSRVNPTWWKGKINWGDKQLILEESDEGGGDTKRILVSAGCPLAALNLIAYPPTNYQVR